MNTGKNGSLQAAQSIGASIKTLLGPSNSLKCCIGEDDDDAIICSSAFKILQCIDVKHPSWFVISDSCEGLHKTCGNGCKTLLCMIGCWSKQAATLQSQGIPIATITQLFDEALDECIKVLKEIKIPLQDIKYYNWIFHTGLKHHLDKNNLPKLHHCKSSDQVFKNNVDLDTSNIYLSRVNISKDKPKIHASLQHFESVKDEFDDSFENAEGTSVSHFSSLRPDNRVSSKTIRKSSYSSYKSALVKQADEMPYNLSLLGLSSRMTKPKRDYSQIAFSSRNLMPNTPKTGVTHHGQSEKSFTSKQKDFDLTVKANLKQLGDLLSHGQQKEMELAVDVVFAHLNQASRFSKFKLDSNCIHVETVCHLKSENSQVVNGIMLKTTSKIPHLPKKNVRIALVNGDITNEFRHAGYKDSFHVKQIVHEVHFQEFSHEGKQKWLHEVCKVIEKYHIGALVCRGKIDNDLEKLCQSLDILTVCHISSKVLKLLASSLGSSLIVYLTDLQGSEIGNHVCLHHWLLPGQKTENHSYVVVNTNENSDERSENLLLTVFLSSQTQHLLMELELAFWNCISRLKNTIDENCILPGAGYSEVYCVKRLRSLAGKKEDQSECRSSNWIKRSLSFYRDIVYSAFADGLVEFLTTLKLNTGEVLHHGQALAQIDSLICGEFQDTQEQSLLSLADVFSAKVYAWQRAVSVVCLLMQSDMIVETGLQLDQQT